MPGILIELLLDMFADSLSALEPFFEYDGDHRSFSTVCRTRSYEETMSYRGSKLNSIRVPPGSITIACHLGPLPDSSGANST